MALKIFADCQTGSVSIPGMICVKQLKNTDTNFKKVDFFDTQVDLLFMKLMLHFCHVKQINSQPTHLSLELLLHLQISRGTEDF